MPMIEIHDDEFLLLKKYLYDSCGIDIPAEKSYLFKTRLNDLLLEENFSSFKELYVHLKAEKNGRLNRRLIQFMTTNETSFFRDTHPFDTLKEILLPYLTSLKTKDTIFPPELKIWSAGCSTGQEPYSIAITLMEWMESQRTFTPDRVSILATDISNGVIKTAKEGKYREHEIKRGMPDAYMLKYFKETDGYWVADKKLKTMINFKELNMSLDFEKEIGFFDIIFCRNVIIYFSMDLKRNILDKIYNILNPGGILVIGASENLYQLTDKFEVEYNGQSIFYRVKK